MIKKYLTSLANEISTIVVDELHDALEEIREELRSDEVPTQLDQVLENAHEAMDEDERKLLVKLSKDPIYMSLLSKLEFRVGKAGLLNFQKIEDVREVRGGMKMLQTLRAYMKMAPHDKAFNRVTGDGELENLD